MINVLVNGTAENFQQPITIDELLKKLSIDPKHNKIAVEINASICPRYQHQSHKIQNNDKIEIITAVGGG